MSVTTRYREAWEGFWREAPDERGAVFWDSDPALTARVHLALFEPHLAAPGLPLVDLGCGNGTQTRFLADRYPRVVGAQGRRCGLAEPDLSELKEFERVVGMSVDHRYPGVPGGVGDAVGVSGRIG